MFAKAETFQQILISLSVLRYVIVSNCERGLTDIAIEAEDFFCELLNTIGGYRLQNLNRIIPNHPAIDLGCELHGCGIQVTATNTAQKITETIDTLYQKNLHEKYPNLVILILSHKKDYTTKFDTSRLASFNIWDLDDILRIIERRPANGTDEPLYRAIETLIRRELPGVVSAVAPPSSILAQLEVRQGRNAQTANSFLRHLNASQDEKRGIKDDIDELLRKLQDETYRAARSFLFAALQMSLTKDTFLNRYRDYPDYVSDDVLLCDLSLVARRLGLNNQDAFHYMDDLVYFGLARYAPELWCNKNLYYLCFASPHIDHANLLCYLVDFVRGDYPKLRRIIEELNFTELD